SDAEIYDPVTQVWTPTGSLNFPRFGFATILLLSGKVLAIGGFAATANAAGSAELYDPSTGRWSVITGPPRGLPECTVTRLQDGRVIFAGGLAPSPHQYVSTHAVFLFDPVQAPNPWRLVGGLNVARRGHNATLLSNGKVLVVGGFDRSLGAGGYLMLK